MSAASMSMSSPAKRIRVLYEGHEDRVVLQRICAALPELAILEVKHTEKSRGGGTTGILKELRGFVARAARVVVVRDLDDLAPEGCGDWLVREIRGLGFDADRGDCDGGSGVTVVTARGENGESRIAVVPVGLPGIADEVGIEGIAAFAMDDYLIRLALRGEVYASVSDFEDVPHDKVQAKLTRFTHQLRDNGLPIATSKRLVDLLKGITGLRASPAELADRLLDAAGADMAPLLAPIPEQLMYALQAVRAPRTRDGTKGSR